MRVKRPEIAARQLVIVGHPEEAPRSAKRVFAAQPRFLITFLKPHANFGGLESNGTWNTSFGKFRL